MIKADEVILFPYSVSAPKPAALILAKCEWERIFKMFIEGSIALLLTNIDFCMRNEKECFICIKESKIYLIPHLMEEKLYNIS